MIVKNEAPTLPVCLDSVRGLLHEVIVVDTGSSDSTREIAAENGARVVDFPWPDSFAAARNEAIRHATGDWLLWLDADDRLDASNRDKLGTLLASLSADNAAYVMKCFCLPDHISGRSAVVDHVRLFRNHPELRWEYRVHEQILPAVHRAGHIVRFTDIIIEHTGYQNPSLQQQKLERNLRLLKLDLMDRPDDLFLLFNLGWAYADLGRFAEAVPLLQRSLQHSHPADSITPKLYVLLAQCHRHLRQSAEAWAACQAGCARCPDDAELLFLKGQLSHERGDRAVARSCWLRLLPASNDTQAPPVPNGVFTSVDAGLRGHLARHHLAVLSREEGRPDEAEGHWQAALADAPDFQPARLGLAELYLQQGRFSHLDQLIDQLRRDPRVNGDAAVLQARAHLARQDFAAARQLLEETIRQAPQAVSPHVVLSHVLLQAGDEAAAEPVLLRVVELDPRQAESWRNLAVLLRRRGRLREAITAAQSGRVHCPHDPDLLLLYAALLREGGAAVNAEACLLRLLEGDSGDGPARRRRLAARHHLALLCRDQGRLPEAAGHWRSLLAEEPSDRAAWLRLAECYLALGRWDDLGPVLARLEGESPPSLDVLLLSARVRLAAGVGELPAPAGRCPRPGTG